MPVINPGDVWIPDFGMAAKVRPALLLTGSPADEELHVVTVLLHTTALRGNRWQLNIQNRFSSRVRFTCNKSKRFRPSSWSAGWAR
jgi:mRNA-degrading endonuclease toxin of MazEF toxin-antitoxin module